VRLRTLFAAVNRADVEIRRGTWPVQAEVPFPYTPGLEVLGRVDAVGPFVAALAPGQLVVTMMQRLGGIHGERPGGYGEHVTVPAEALAPVPEDADAAAVAAAGLAAVTALEGLRRLGLQPGQTVVVHGAAGGVGSAAVALARRSGARVVGTVHRAAQQAYVRALGADDVVLLTEGGLVDQLGARSTDAVLETLGASTFPDSVAVLRRGGRLCIVGALTGPELSLQAWDLLQDLHLTGYSSENLTGQELRADISEVVAALTDGSLQPPSHRVLPMREAAQAHRLLEQGGFTGRLLLSPDL
jgi:NADPH2:quinone reductase